MIEEGFYNGSISRSIIENYLAHPDLQGIDVLLLACTHYPLIKNQIAEILGHNVTIMDSTDVVREEVYSILDAENLLSEKKFAEDAFYVSDYTSSFEETATLFYGEDIKLESIPIWK
jgi:glutamate racemase